jgi:hypothetical protein
MGRCEGLEIRRGIVEVCRAGEAVEECRVGIMLRVFARSQEIGFVLKLDDCRYERTRVVVGMVGSSPSPRHWIHGLPAFRTHSEPQLRATIANSHNEFPRTPSSQHTLPFASPTSNPPHISSQCAHYAPSVPVYILHITARISDTLPTHIAITRRKHSLAPKICPLIAMRARETWTHSLATKSNAAPFGIKRCRPKPLSTPRSIRDMPTWLAPECEHVITDMSMYISRSCAPPTDNTRKITRPHSVSRR